MKYIGNNLGCILFFTIALFFAGNASAQRARPFVKITDAGGGAEGGSTCTGAVTFPDKGLEDAVRWALRKPAGDIKREDLARLTRFSAFRFNIKDLTNIHCLQNLEWLELIGNRISDLGPLANLSNLKVLYLSGNRIRDIRPLSKLTKLEALALSWNDIRDLSALADLTSLNELYVSNNRVKKLDPLGRLTKLTWVSLEKNAVSDISALGNLVNLEELDLRGNKIKDIGALKYLTKLALLDLRENRIRDIEAISDLRRLEWLVLESNKIKSIAPLVANPGLDATDIVVVRQNPLACEEPETLINIDLLDKRGMLFVHDCDVLLTN